MQYYFLNWRTERHVTNMSGQDSIFSVIFNSGSWLSSNENIIQIAREASVFIMKVWGLIMACDVHTTLFCSLIKGVTSLYDIAV